MTIQLPARRAVTTMSSDRPDGMYMVEPTEYVRSSDLPDDPLFDNQEEIKSILKDARDSLGSRTSEEIACAIAEVLSERSAKITRPAFHTGI